MKPRIIATLLIFLSAAPGCSRPPDSASSSATVVGASRAAPVVWTIEPLTAPITASRGTVRVLGHINGGWHIYSTTQPAGGPVATRITLPDGQPFAEAGSVESLVAPSVAYDDAFRMKVEVHEHDVAFAVPVRAVGAATSGDSVRINVRYQVCNDSLCYPAQTARLAAAVPQPRA